MDILIAGMVVVSFSMAMLGIIYLVKGTRLSILERLETYTRDTKTNYMIPELNQPLKERLMALILQFLSRFSGRFISKNKKEIYEERLLAAGYPHGLTVESFVVLKGLILLLMLVMGIFSRNLLGLVLCVAIGFLLPDLYLKHFETKRKVDILKSLPDILDLITISVEAGLGFDAALQKVTEKFNGPLSDEFAKTLQEINIGKPRREALRDMAGRINVDDVTTFLGSIIQADQLGVSITNVLTLQSQQVRASRRMRAEETAQKAPIKILLPLVFFVFPTILIVLLGPALIQLIDAM